ncbi:MAG TPA: endonuclease III, partial [Candidatus Binatia bacterium]
MAETYESPFRVLISCILSLRTQDSTTAKASHRLFAVADSPRAMLKLTAKKIAKLIYPVGFYKTKAKNILEICRRLVNDYAGSVPDEIDELLKFKGVGRKTANLVVTLGYKKPGICVDTHVHRISNRW